MSYFKYHDQHSGGGLKTGYSNIYIEVEEPRNEYEKELQKEIANKIFWELFKRDPENTTCGTCGSDFYIDEVLSLKDVERDLNDPWYKKMASIIVPIDGRKDATKRIIKGEREKSRYGKWNDEE